MRVDVVLQHCTEGNPQMLPASVEGEDVATQCPASKCAQLQKKKKSSFEKKIILSVWKSLYSYLLKKLYKLAANINLRPTFIVKNGAAISQVSALTPSGLGCQERSVTSCSLSSSPSSPDSRRWLNG